MGNPASLSGRVSLLQRKAENVISAGKPITPLLHHSASLRRAPGLRPVGIFVRMHFLLLLCAESSVTSDKLKPRQF
jgi:hypothetical protein